jgi:hypothetical protein
VATVARREFPALCRAVQAFEKAAFLLLPGNIEKELENDHAVFGVLFEGIDVVESLPPDVMLEHS